MFKEEVDGVGTSHVGVSLPAGDGSVRVALCGKRGNAPGVLLTGESPETFFDPLYRGHVECWALYEAASAGSGVLEG